MTARSRSATLNQSTSSPGDTTMPSASSHTRPDSVGQSTSTLKSGAGWRGLSAPTTDDRAAISTRASALRWADVRHRSSSEGSLPRSSRARAQSALKNSSSIRFNSFGDDRSRDRVEGHLAQVHPRERRLEVDVSPGAPRFCGLLGAIGVRELVPIGDRANELLEAEPLGLLDEHRLVASQDLLVVLSSEGGDRVEVRRRELTALKGLGYDREVAEMATPSHQPTAHRPRKAAHGGYPRCRSLGTVDAPVTACLECGNGVCCNGLQSRQLANQARDGGPVTVRSRAFGYQLVNGLHQGLDTHAPITSCGCHIEWLRQSPWHCAESDRSFFAQPARSATVLSRGLHATSGTRKQQRSTRSWPSARSVAAKCCMARLAATNRYGSAASTTSRSDGVTSEVIDFDT